MSLREPPWVLRPQPGNHSTCGFEAQAAKSSRPLMRTRVLSLTVHQVLVTPFLLLVQPFLRLQSRRLHLRLAYALACSLGPTPTKTPITQSSPPSCICPCLLSCPSVSHPRSILRLLVPRSKPSCSPFTTHGPSHMDSCLTFSIVINTCTYKKKDMLHAYSLTPPVVPHT